MDSINITRLCVKSFNCKGFKPRNYSYIKKVFEDASILLIQEHWLYNFEFEHFSKILTNSSYHAKSSMQDKRPYSDAPTRGPLVGGPPLTLRCIGQTKGVF